MNEDITRTGGEDLTPLTDEEFNQAAEEVEAQLFEAREVLDYLYRRRALLDLIATARKRGQACLEVAGEVFRDDVAASLGIEQ